MITITVEEDSKIGKTHFKTWNEFNNYFSWNFNLPDIDNDIFSCNIEKENFNTLTSNSLPWTEKDEKIWN